MGSCSSTGVSRAGSPIQTSSNHNVHTVRHPQSNNLFSSVRRNSSLTPEGFDLDRMNLNGEAHAPSEEMFCSSNDLFDFGRDDHDVPLRTIKPIITDTQLDSDCIGSGIVPGFYKNLATCSLGEYERIPTDTDLFQTAYTPETIRACYVRMRHLYAAIEQDRIGKATLLKNLHYSIMVMESTYVSERRRIRDEEDLSEAATEYVPDEVRNWLAITFTRTHNNSFGGEHKNRFRSVANAIRAGIFVERIYRRMSSCTNLVIPPNVLLFLKTGLDSWSFDVFSLNEASENHALKFVGYELLHKYDLINKFQINPSTLEAFLLQLEIGYSKHNNPYHNLIHAADVTQCCHMIMYLNNLRNWLSELDVFAVLFSALIHDYEHTGTTNNYHIVTKSDLALTYNDKGVLENYHVSAIFKLMQDNEFNILSGLKPDQYKEFRQMTIDMVLCTDMSLHFQQIKNMKTMISVPEDVDKSKALSLIVHCADIGHPAKSWSLHEKWTDMLCEEFFRQGDREKEMNLPVSPLCDRNTVVIPQSQIGFIDFIVEPSFQLLGDMIERIVAPSSRASSDNEVKRLDSANAAAASLETTVPRPWAPCFQDNKSHWSAQAEQASSKT